MISHDCMMVKKKNMFFLFYFQLNPGRPLFLKAISKISANNEDVDHADACLLGCFRQSYTPVSSHVASRTKWAYTGIEVFSIGDCMQEKIFPTEQPIISRLSQQHLRKFGSQIETPKITSVLLEVRLATCYSQ